MHIVPTYETPFLDYLSRTSLTAWLHEAPCPFVVASSRAHVSFLILESTGLTVLSAVRYASRGCETTGPGFGMYRYDVGVELKRPLDSVR